MRDNGAVMRHPRDEKKPRRLHKDFLCLGRQGERSVTGAVLGLVLANRSCDLGNDVLFAEA